MRWVMLLFIFEKSSISTRRHLCVLITMSVSAGSWVRWSGKLSIRCINMAYTISKGDYQMVDHISLITGFNAMTAALKEVQEWIDENRISNSDDGMIQLEMDRCQALVNEQSNLL